MFEELGRFLGLNLEEPGAIYRSDQESRPRRRPARPAPPVDLTASLKAEIEAVGRDVFASVCDVVHRDGDAYLLTPPPPWRGRLRLLFDVDPNPGPDGVHRRVLLIVRADLARTCREAAAATFGIDPRYYRPERQV